MIVGKNLIAARTTSRELDIGAGFARLVLQKRDGSSIVVSLRHRTNLVGSADGCRVRLRSSDIAPLHAVITRDPTGLQIRRLDPAGRLELNREPIDVSYLRDGDKIRVGPISMELSTNVRPVEATALLQDFAKHIKTRLSADSPDFAIGADDEANPTANESAGRPDSAKESENVHRWQQLSDQLEQQEQLLTQVEKRLGENDQLSDPRVQNQVHELSQIHDRIRNEIALLRMRLRPKDKAAVVDTAATAKKESPSGREVPDRPPVARRPHVVMGENNTQGPASVVVDNYSCDECCGVIFERRKFKWYEWPAWLIFMRGVECSTCEHRTLHLASRIKTLE